MIVIASNAIGIYVSLINYMYNFRRYISLFILQVACLWTNCL